MLICSEDPAVLRRLADNPNFVSQELFKADPNGHKFKPGQTCTLTGLVDFPEYNGDKVEITAFRCNGSHGKAYYVKGRINHVVNWVYEYRLQ
jgi:hypothetical protein